MTEPKIFFISRIEVSEISIELPSKKTIVFTRSTRYKTSDPEEMQFLSGVKGIGCQDLDDKEYRIWAQAQFANMPSVDNPDIKSVEDVAEYLWRDPVDKLILAFLTANGYLVNDQKKEDEDPEATTQDPAASGQALDPTEPPSVSKPTGPKHTPPKSKTGVKGGKI